MTRARSLASAVGILAAVLVAPACGSSGSSTPSTDHGKIGMDAGPAGIDQKADATGAVDAGVDTMVVPPDLGGVDALPADMGTPPPQVTLDSGDVIGTQAGTLRIF